MTTYREMTEELADHWVAAMGSAGETAERMTQTVQSATPPEVPGLQIPESLANLNEALIERFPTPTEVVEANFDFTSKLLTAQRDLSLRLLKAATRTADATTPPAAKKTDQKSTPAKS
jgi:hypothetical protein